MPLPTPSPHRFLAPAPPAAQKPKPKPPSGLRHAAAAQTPRQTALHPPGASHGPDEPGRVTPAKRFVAPPPSSRNTPRSGERGNDACPYTQATPRPKPRFRKVESIDSTSPSSSAKTEGHESPNTLSSIAQSSRFGQDEGRDDDDEGEDILFMAEERSKRRRISPHPSPSPVSAYTDAAARHKRSSPQIASPVSHRFKAPAVPDNTWTPVPDRQPNPRPHFILPHLSPSPTKSAVPLPETFSPSRKNGKYIPNGMAATLQSWVHETASTGYTANASSAMVWGKAQEDGVKIKVQVIGVMGGQGDSESEVECWPGGVVFLRGVANASLYNAPRASSFVQFGGFHDRDTDVKVMLAGQGGVRAKGGIRIREGGVVGLRAPIWSVHVGRGEPAEKWLVGVEWVVL